MEDVLVWIFWAVIMVVSIVSSASKAKKKREEAERRAAGVARAQATKDAQASGAAREARTAQPRTARAGTAWEVSPPAKKSLAQILKELAEEATNQPSPTVIPTFGPVVGPTATSFDYQSLEDQYIDRDDEYVFGQDGQGARQNAGSRPFAAPVPDTVTSSVRKDVVSSSQAMASNIARQASERQVRSGGAEPQSRPGAEIAAEDDSVGGLAGILGDEFDLRRAVIEAEILTPKYATRY